MEPTCEPLPPGDAPHEEQEEHTIIFVEADEEAGPGQRLGATAGEDHLPRIDPSNPLK